MATSQPLLRQRAQSERDQIAKVENEFSTRFAVVPMQADEPVGVERLRNLSETSLYKLAV